MDFRRSVTYPIIDTELKETKPKANTDSTTSKDEKQETETLMRSVEVAS